MCIYIYIYVLSSSRKRPETCFLDTKYLELARCGCQGRPLKQRYDINSDDNNREIILIVVILVVVIMSSSSDNNHHHQNKMQTGF